MDWSTHFPKRGDREACESWRPYIRRHELAMRVIAVAKTRIEGSWAAYIDAVPGDNHDRETPAVLERGAKLREPVARVLFPELEGVPYAP